MRIMVRALNVCWLKRVVVVTGKFIVLNLTQPLFQCKICRTILVDPCIIFNCLRLLEFNPKKKFIQHDIVPSSFDKSMRNIKCHLRCLFVCVLHTFDDTF